MIFDEDNFPEIPGTWSVVAVQDACENVPIAAKVPAKEYLAGGVLPVIDQGERLIGGYADDVSLAASSQLPVIVFGDHTRAIKFVDFPFAAGADGIKVLRPLTAFEPRLFYRVLQAVRLPNKGYARHFQHLRSSQIPLPPLPEQKRIADKLDSVLARVDACRDRLDRIPALLKRFRQSVLAAATFGRLTAEWREGATNSEWELVSVGALCDAVFDGPFGSNLKSDDYVPSGVRVVRLENITHLAFDAAKETYVSEKKYESLVKHTLAPDDVLFSSFVDEEVRVCLYPEGLPTKAINKADCFVLRADKTRCLPKYLALRLACKTTYLDLKELVHGATRPRINLKQLKQYALDLPSLAEQHEIVRRVETLFAFADRLEARCAAARKQAGQLTPALLAKAFRGELVPQDPADEPAAELLKRLAASRGEAPRARRGRKPVAAGE